MKIVKIITAAAFVMMLAPMASAQNGKNVDLSGTVKTSHLWRGYQVSGEVTTAGSIDVMTNDGSLKGGIWGGYGVTGAFKEFDYYIQFSKGGFTAALWDIYNFSPGIYGPSSAKQYSAFNYEAENTGHFVDLSVAYRFQGGFPLQISWATVIFGRDRALNSDGEMKNQYSNYVSLDYPIGTFKGVSLNAGIAGAFAFGKAHSFDGLEWVSNDSNFYGKTNGIVNVNLTASKDITIGGYKVPVSVGAMWNPMDEKVYMCVAVNLF